MGDGIFIYPNIVRINLELKQKKKTWHGEWSEIFEDSDKQ